MTDDPVTSYDRDRGNRMNKKNAIFITVVGGCRGESRVSGAASPSGTGHFESRDGPATEPTITERDARMEINDICARRGQT